MESLIQQIAINFESQKKAAQAELVALQAKVVELEAGIQLQARLMVNMADRDEKLSRALQILLERVQEYDGVMDNDDLATAVRAGKSLLDPTAPTGDMSRDPYEVLAKYLPEVNSEGDLVLSRVYQAIGIQVGTGFFGVCERDGGLQVTRHQDGQTQEVWSSVHGVQK